jgi:protein involved in polysaccharide export with SLBB domain
VAVAILILGDARSAFADEVKAPGKSVPTAAAAPAVSDLEERRQTLEGEVRYTKAKLAAAQKQFSIITAKGDVEKAGRLFQVVKDWQERYDASKSQLKETDRKIADASQGSVAAGSAIAAGDAAKAAASDGSALLEQQSKMASEFFQLTAVLEEARENRLVAARAREREKVGTLTRDIVDAEKRLSALREKGVENEKQIELAGIVRTDDEVIVPGEYLLVSVNEDASFDNLYQVRRGGYIIMPQVGRIAVAAKMIPAAEAAVKRALLSSQLTAATVTIERKPAWAGPVGPQSQIQLAGEFKMPGAWAVPVRSIVTPTLVDVLLACGGVTEKADLTHVTLEYHQPAERRDSSGRRVTRERETIDCEKALTSGGVAPFLDLHAGDVITIPAGNDPAATQRLVQRLWDSKPAVDPRADAWLKRLKDW